MKSLAEREQLTPPPRKASREYRRLQLIEATVETLARRGYAQMTLSDVAMTAGLSHGLVNFHFETKQKLLTATLLFLAAEYRDNWTSALAAAPASPAAQLGAMLMADFNERICTQSKLTAWCAFWGEAQSRPIYEEICGSSDLEYVSVLEGVCARLIATGRYRLDAVQVARVLRVTVEGLWLDLQTMASPYSREEAQRTVYVCAAAFFPKHFDEAGLLEAA